jgi:hypothetical protein
MITQGIVNSARSLRARGCDFVLVSDTFHAPDLESFMQAKVLPATVAAVNAMGDDSGIGWGARLRTDLGILTVGATAGLIGLQADRVHHNNEARRPAGQLLVNSMVAKGIIKSA